MTNLFVTYHPAVAFVFLASAIVLAMATMHPVYVCISVAGALASSCAIRGVRKTAGSLKWAVPMVLIIALANPIISSSGSTELFRIGLRAVYAESLVYGLCAGGMLASVLLWFSIYSDCMGSEQSMALFGNALPVVTLMVSQVMRLVPQFLKRGRTISGVQKAASAAAPKTKRDAARGRMRVISVLMGWGMEDGLVRSDAMRSRGYDCGARRTTYKRWRMHTADVLLIAVVLALAIASAAFAIAELSRFSFYPALSAFGPWWTYAPYGALVLVPVFLKMGEWWQWKSYE